MWYKIRKDNEIQYVNELNGIDTELWEVVCSLPRALQEFEYADDEGNILENTVYKIDVKAGTEHINTARNLKLVEALLIKQKTSLLAEEAKLRGISLDEMADLVLEKADPLLTIELERISAKLGEI